MVIEIVMVADNIDVMSARAECEDHLEATKTIRPFSNKTNMSDTQCDQSHILVHPAWSPRQKEELT